MRWFALVLWSVLLLALAAADASAQITGWPYAASSDSTFHVDDMSPRHFEILAMPTFEYTVTAVPDTVDISNLTWIDAKADASSSDPALFHVETPTPATLDAKAKIRPTVLITTDLGDGTKVVYTGW